MVKSLTLAAGKTHTRCYIVHIPPPLLFEGTFECLAGDVPLAGFHSLFVVVMYLSLE